MATAQSLPAIELRALSAAYGRSTVLSRISLSLPRGAFAAVAGPAGAGKSTLLRCILGRQPATSGNVQVLGHSPAEVHSRIGYVPRDDLPDWRFPLSVAEAVLMGRYRQIGLLRRPGAADRAIVRRCLAEWRLDHQAERPVGTLTLAERRRLLVARALAREPDLLLLDDTLAGLGAESAAELSELLRGCAGRGLTVLLATRGLAGLAERFELVLLLNGLLIAAGRPEEVLTRANLQATFGAEQVALTVPATRLALDG